jgi:hypothetical protein
MKGKDRISVSLTPTRGLRARFEHIVPIHIDFQSLDVERHSGNISWVGSRRTGRRRNPGGSGGYLPCVVYQAGTPKKYLELMYRTKSGTWSTETVDDSVEVIGDLSLAVDDAGRIHISYYDYDNGDMKYARRLAVY